MTMSTKQVTIRLPEDLIELIDKHAVRMRSRTPGMRVSRSDAVRVLLTRALEEELEEEKK